MRNTRASIGSGLCPASAVATVLVLSQHEGVRRQLVVYLGRAQTLHVSGDLFSTQAILQARPDVVVLDLSQLKPGSLGRAIDASRQVGASLIALASMRDLADEHEVTDAGGLYRLKSAGADGLADVVNAAAARRGASLVPRRGTSEPAAPNGVDQRPARRRDRVERGRLRA